MFEEQNYPVVLSGTRLPKLNLKHPANAGMPLTRASQTEKHEKGELTLNLRGGEEQSRPDTTLQPF